MWLKKKQKAKIKEKKVGKLKVGCWVGLVWVVVVEIEEKEEGFVGNDLISKMNIEEREEK